jgi:transposase
MTMPSDDHMSSADAARAQRIEVFTGAGRRRGWADEQKALIVAESYRSGNVSEVARRHGLTPTQLFAWRRAARVRVVAARDTAPEFVPALMEASTGKGPEPQAPDADPLIGFELEGANVWICAGAEAGMVTTIIRALKAAR